MKQLSALHELNNGKQIRTQLCTTGQVTLDLQTVDPADGKRFTELAITVNPNDINDMSQSCGKVMAKAYGHPNQDTIEWSAIWKALSRYKARTPLVP